MVTGMIFSKGALMDGDSQGQNRTEFTTFILTAYFGRKWEIGTS